MGELFLEEINALESHPTFKVLALDESFTDILKNG
jgi:hypothetical protein